MKNKIVALLPMKGHSERVPNKNMKLFNGIPLYHSIMESLQDSDSITKIIINTDSDIIAEDATKNFSKVEIYKRPEELQGDFVPMNDIIEYDITTCRDSDFFLQTHSTNPLLTTETIDEAVKCFFEKKEQGYDSLFGVTKIQSRFYWESGEAINHNPNELLRTQDLPPIFEENSNAYIFSKESFKNADKKRIGLKPWMFEINKLEAVDIDDAEDFILAENLAKILNK